MDYVEALGWDYGTEVTLTVDDPVTPENPDHTYLGTFGYAPWNPGLTHVNIPLDIELQPGYVIEMSGGGKQREFTVSSLTIDASEIDLENDVVTGTAGPGSNVNVNVYYEMTEEEVSLQVAADEAGNWTANFNGLLDLDYGMDFEANLGTLYGGNTRYMVYIPPSAACNEVTEIPQAECQALVALYNNTGGTDWTDHTNWLETDTPCSWHGITCVSEHVETIYLPTNNLTGVIPVEIGDLQNFEEYAKSFRKQFNGLIPPSLGLLANLEFLWLNSNAPDRSIPVEFGSLTSVKHLILETNQLSGTIPSSLGSLPNLLI